MQVLNRAPKFNGAFFSVFGPFTAQKSAKNGNFQISCIQMKDLPKNLPFLAIFPGGHRFERSNLGPFLGHFSSVNADFSRVWPSRQQPQKSNRFELGEKKYIKTKEI